MGVGIIQEDCSGMEMGDRLMETPLQGTDHQVPRQRGLWCGQRSCAHPGAWMRGPFLSLTSVTLWLMDGLLGQHQETWRAKKGHLLHSIQQALEGRRGAEMGVFSNLAVGLEMSPGADSSSPASLLSWAYKPF